MRLASLMAVAIACGSGGVAAAQDTVFQENNVPSLPEGRFDHATARAVVGGLLDHDAGRGLAWAEWYRLPYALSYGSSHDAGYGMQNFVHEAPPVMGVGIPCRDATTYVTRFDTAQPRLLLNGRFCLSGGAWRATRIVFVGAAPLGYVYSVDLAQNWTRRVGVVDVHPVPNGSPVLAPEVAHPATDGFPREGLRDR